MSDSAVERDSALPNKPERPNPVRTGAYDAIADDLQALRAQAGAVSYAQIVLRIARRREAEGMDPVAARPARTTVYDCFRHGRTRVNPVLVGEIVLALTDDPDRAREWVARCSEARLAAERRGTEPVRMPAADASTPAVSPEAATSPADAPTPAADAPAEPLSAPPPAADVPAAPASPSVPTPAPARVPLGVLPTVALVLTCLGANLLGTVASRALQLPVFGDMIGTAVSAMVLGPWAGAAVGLTSHLASLSLTEWQFWPFALVQVVGALVWGYGVRRLAVGGSVSRLFFLGVVAAIACTLTATPILALADVGGPTDPSHPLITRLSELLGTSVVGVFGGNLFTSLLDKLVASFVSVAFVTASPALRAATPWLRPPGVPSAQPAGAVLLGPAAEAGHAGQAVVAQGPDSPGGPGVAAETVPGEAHHAGRAPGPRHT